MQREGYITRVRKNAVHVLVPTFGLEGPVYFDPVKDAPAPVLKYDTEAMTLTVSAADKVSTVPLLTALASF